MSATISDKVMMKEVLRATGFDCPQGMENKTFEEATSGGGGGGGGSGSGITVEPITITQNGTTTAPSGKAYSPVTVNVNVPSSVSGVTMEHVQTGRIETAGTPVTLSYVYDKELDANYVVWFDKEQINTRDLAVGQIYNYTTSVGNTIFDITLRKETVSWGPGYKVTANFRGRREVNAPLNCFLVVGTLK